jgi:hypothetical protein
MFPLSSDYPRFSGQNGEQSGGDGRADLPPDLLHGSDVGGDGPVLPETFEPEYGPEGEGPGDFFDIGLHFYEKMNEL